MTTELSEEKLLELGRAVHDILTAPDSAIGSNFVLVFQLFDHRRRIEISALGPHLMWSEPIRADMTIKEITLPGALFPKER